MLGFIIGFFVGGTFGFCVCALISVASDKK